MHFMIIGANTHAEASPADGNLRLAAVESRPG
jgi:hypothetical protein